MTEYADRPPQAAYPGPSYSDQPSQPGHGSQPGRTPDANAPYGGPSGPGSPYPQQGQHAPQGGQYQQPGQYQQQGQHQQPSYGPPGQAGFQPQGQYAQPPAYGPPGPAYGGQPYGQPYPGSGSAPKRGMGMIIGGIVLVVLGVLITVGTFIAAPGGHFYISFGLPIAGIGLIIRGFIRRNAGGF